MPLPPQTLMPLALAQQRLTPGAAGHALQLLYVAAAVLAVILLAVIALATVAWHKNKDKDLRP